MAGEIQVAHHSAGKTLYAVVRNTTGSVWQTTTSTFVPYATAGLAGYAIPLAEQGTASRFYAGPFPAAAPGTYAVAVYERAGASPAEGNALAAAGNVEWDGAALVPLAGRAAAAAVAAVQTDVDDIQARLPATLIGGRMDCAVGAMASNVLTAAAIATDAIDADALAASAVSEIQAGLSTLTAAQVWDEALAGHPAAGTAGKALSDAAAAAGLTAADVWAHPARTLTGFGFSVQVGSFSDDALTAAALAPDAVAAVQAGLATAAAQGDLQARLPAALVGGRMDASVGAMQANVLTAAALATDAANEVADALLGRAGGVEPTVTVREALRLILAALAGKLSGAAAGTVRIRDVTDTKDRITATVDQDGNRLAVALDPS